MKMNVKVSPGLLDEMFTKIKSFSHIPGQSVLDFRLKCDERFLDIYKKHDINMSLIKNK